MAPKSRKSPTPRRMQAVAGGSADPAPVTAMDIGKKATDTWHVDKMRLVYIHAVRKTDVKAVGPAAVPLVAVGSTNLRMVLEDGLKKLEPKFYHRSSTEGVTNPGREFSHAIGHGVVALVGNSSSCLYKTADGQPRVLPEVERVDNPNEKGATQRPDSHHYWFKYKGHFTDVMRQELFGMVTVPTSEEDVPPSLRDVEGVSVVFVDGGHRGRLVQMHNDALVRGSPNLAGEHEVKFARAAYLVLLPPLETIEAIEARCDGQNTSHETLAEHLSVLLNHMAAELNILAQTTVSVTARSALISAFFAVTNQWNIYYDKKGMFDLHFNTPTSWAADAPALAEAFAASAASPMIVQRRRPSIESPYRNSEVFHDETYKVFPDFDNVGKNLGKIFKGHMEFRNTGDNGTAVHKCVVCSSHALMSGAADTAGMESLLHTPPADDSTPPADDSETGWSEHTDNLVVPVWTLPSIAPAATRMAKIACGWEGLVKKVSGTANRTHYEEGVFAGARKGHVAALQASFHSGFDNVSQSMMLFIMRRTLERCSYSTDVEKIPFANVDETDAMRRFVFGSAHTNSISNLNRAKGVQPVLKALEGYTAAAGLRLQVLHALSGALGFLSPASLVRWYCPASDLAGPMARGEWAVRHLRVSFHSLGTTETDKAQWTTNMEDVRASGMPTSAFDMVLDPHRNRVARNLLVNKLELDGYVGVLHWARRDLAELGQRVANGDFDKDITAAFTYMLTRDEDLRKAKKIFDGVMRKGDWTDKLKHIMPLFLVACLGSDVLKDQYRSAESLPQKMADVLVTAWCKQDSAMDRGVAASAVTDGLRGWALSVEESGSLYGTSILSGCEGLSEIFTDKTSNYKTRAVEAAAEAKAKRREEKEREKERVAEAASEVPEGRDEEAQSTRQEVTTGTQSQADTLDKGAASADGDDVEPPSETVHGQALPVVEMEAHEVGGGGGAADSEEIVPTPTSSELRAMRQADTETIPQGVELQNRRLHTKQTLEDDEAKIHRVKNRGYVAPRARGTGIVTTGHCTDMCRILMNTAPEQESRAYKKIRVLAKDLRDAIEKGPKDLEQALAAASGPQSSSKSSSGGSDSSSSGGSSRTPSTSSSSADDNEDDEVSDSENEEAVEKGSPGIEDAPSGEEEAGSHASAAEDEAAPSGDVDGNVMEDSRRDFQSGSTVVRLRDQQSKAREAQASSLVRKSQRLQKKD